MRNDTKMQTNIKELAVKMHTKEAPKPATQAYVVIRRGEGKGLTKVGV